MSIGRARAVMARQHGLITRAQALEARLDARDIQRLQRTGAWTPVFRGVYVDTELWVSLDSFREQPLLRIRALALCRPGGTYAFSHASSALILGMGIPLGAGDTVHVTQRRLRGDATRVGVKFHLAPYRDQDVMTVDGLPVLSPARTALDLGREYGRVAGLAGCDAARRLGVSVAELQGVLERMSCWPGSRIMRESIEDSDPGAQNYFESECRRFVLDLGLGRPETQVGLTDGHRVVYIDFMILRHGFEPDGALKYAVDNPSGRPGRDVLMREKSRQDFITGFKLGISRMTYRDVHRRRAATEARIHREYDDTCRRFGIDVADLAPYRVQRRIA